MSIELLKKRANDTLNEYLKDVLEKRKYFYLTQDFFSEDLDLTYQLIHFSPEFKELIKEKIIDYSDQGIKLKFNPFSFKNIISIECKDKFFSDRPNSHKNKNLIEIYEEFIIYEFLENKEQKKIQKQNFIKLYIDHLYHYEELKKIISKEFKGFIHSLSMDKFLGKLKELEELEELSESNNINDIEKKIKIEIDRIKNLYIHRDELSKLEFVFYQGNKEELKEILQFVSISSHDKNYFYRGQSNYNFDISSSISRDSALLHYEHELFFDILSLKPNEFINDKTIYEKLITMQHFSLPTRLIDLTRNPLISLYFACNEFSKTDGIVYVFGENKEDILTFDDPKIDCLSKIVKYSSDKDFCKECPKNNIKCNSENILKKSYIVKGIAKNSRISNQSGDFIFVGLGKESKCLEKLNQIPEKMIVISKLLKRFLLEDLKLLNIHAGTVYPELSNMSTHLTVECKKRKTPVSKDKENISTQIEYSTPQLISFNPNILKLAENILPEGQLKKIILKELETEKNEPLEKLKSLSKDRKFKILERKEIDRLLKLYEYLRIIPSYSNQITIVEEGFDWKSYFESPGDIQVPKYNINEWALNKYEIQSITEEGINIYSQENNKLNFKFISHKKFKKYIEASSIGELIANYKFAKESLFD